jgi:large subunit ribosomal protein L13
VLSGDFVVITNASKIVMTGSKLDTKSLRRYSGYPGGQKVETYRTLLEKDPCRVVREAVTRMLPRGPLGRRMAARLKVYAGAEHPHQAQSPQVLEIA